MRVVAQRVAEAEVSVDGVSVGRIGPGLLLLVGVAAGDGVEHAEWSARKIASLRIFDDESGAPSRRSVTEVGGAVLAVSQFTLLADCRKGRRPSYDGAMPGAEAEVLFDRFVSELRTIVAQVETGRFGAEMLVRLVNDGPFTLVVDS
jgi:D-tyrosyl-tRNA(Tyr) deacylase